MQTSWTAHGGDVASRVEAIACSGAVGAVVSVELGPDSSRLVQGERPSSIAEDEVLRNAWQTVVDELPLGTVGRRSAWSRFEFVLEGPKDALCATSKRLLRALTREPPLVCWHVVLTRIFPFEPARTFRCDPGYDLRAADGNVIAWVEPYDGDDWKGSQRHPTVTFLEIDSDI